MTTWRDKANRIIAELCHAAYLKANTLPNGKLRKRHVPYSVPDEALELLDCLNKDDEATAKAIFIERTYR